MKGTSQQCVTKIYIFNFVLLCMGPNEKKFRGTVPLDSKPPNIQKKGSGWRKDGLLTKYSVQRKMWVLVD